MSLNANAKAWTPSFGGAPAAAPAPPAAATTGIPPPPSSAIPPAPVSLGNGIPPPPPSALVGASSPTSSSSGVPPPPPAAALAPVSTGASSSAVPAPPAAAVTTSSTLPHHAAPFVPGSASGAGLGGGMTNNGGMKSHGGAFYPNNNNGGMHGGDRMHNNGGSHHHNGEQRHHNNSNYHNNNGGYGNNNNGGYGNNNNNGGGYRNNHNGGHNNGGGYYNNNVATAYNTAAESFLPEQSDWFRYAVALPSARVVDTEVVTTNNLLMLQTKRSLVAGRSRDKQAFTEYMATYFANARNSSFTNKEALVHINSQSPNGVVPPQFQSPSALVLSRKMLGNPSQPEDIATVTNADGYLIQVIGSLNQPGADITQLLCESWQEFFEVIGPDCSVIGHWMLEVPELANKSTTTVSSANAANPTTNLDTGAAFHHYFFALPKTPTSLSSEGLRTRFSNGQKVTKIRSLISFILTNRLPMAATVKFVAGADYKPAAVVTAATTPASATGTPTTPESASKNDIVSASEENKSPATSSAAASTPTSPVTNNSLAVPPMVVRYNAYDATETMASVQKVVETLERYLTPSSTFNNAKMDALSTAPAWVKTVALSIDFVDVTASPKSPVSAVTAAAALSTDSLFPKLTTPFVLPAFDVLQELLSGLSTMGCGVVGFEHPTAASVSLSAPLETLIAALKPAAFIDAATSSINERSLVVLSARSALASPWGTLPSVYAAGSHVSPFNNVANLTGFRAQAAAFWDALCKAEARTVSLTSEKGAIAANVFAQEPFVVRRTAVGTRVLLLADKNRQLAVFDPQTGSIVSIPAMSWSNQNANIADSVFAATFTHTYRGARLWRIIVDDVYQFNGESCLGKPFTERWAHVDNGVMEHEGAYGHASPFGPMILHATYMNAHEVDRLLDRTRHTAAPIPSDMEHFPDPQYPNRNPHEVVEPVDHATLGVTYVPTMAPVALADEAAAYGGSLPAKHSRPRAINTDNCRDAMRLVPSFTWIPQESLTCVFAVGNIVREGKTAKIFLKMAKSLYVPTAAVTATSPTNGPEGEPIVPPAAAGTSDSLSLLPPPSMGLAASSSTLGASATGATAAAGVIVGAEPVVENRAKKLWASWVAQYGAVVAPNQPATTTTSSATTKDTSDSSNTTSNSVNSNSNKATSSSSSSLVDLEGEYVEVPAVLVDAGYIHQNALIECLVRRQASTNARWWEYTKTIANTSTYSAYAQPAVAPSSDRLVSWVSNNTYLDFAALQWLPKAYQHRCGKCSDVSQKGENDPQTGNFRCNACWKDSGYGDCVHCHKRLIPGSIDLGSKAFYCEGCWQSFTLAHQIVTGPQPPPAGASLELQVMTRIASLLIDDIGKKFPLRDVLDLCVPDTSVVRKWLHAGVETFTGIATEPSVVTDVNRVKGQFLQEYPNKHRDNFSTFACPYALSDMDRFWEETIPARHPKQFSAIFCFYQLHKVFGNKYTARDFFKYVSRALVPGGVFVATFFCPNGYFEKGAPYRNDYFAIKWNAKEFEDSRSRMLAGLPAAPPALASLIPAAGGAAERRADSNEADGTRRGVRESASSTPMPPSIDEPDVDEDDLMTPQNTSASIGAVTSTPAPVAQKSSTPCNNPEEEDDRRFSTVPATPESQIKVEARHADPHATPASAKENPSAAPNAADSPIAAGEIATTSTPATPESTPAAPVAPLVPGKGAWRPKALGAVAVSTPADAVPSTPAATGSNSTNVTGSESPNKQPTAAPETPVFLASELTLPTVGLTYQLTFTENSTGMTREGSSAVWSESDIPPTPASTGTEASVRFPSFVVNDTTRVENVIPLDLLCACADDCGFELVYDHWGKASDMIATDGAWTKPLNASAKEYFNGIKTIVFRKPAKRPHAVSSAPAAL